MYINLFNRGTKYRTVWDLDPVTMINLIRANQAKKVHLPVQVFDFLTALKQDMSNSRITEYIKKQQSWLTTTLKLERSEKNEEKKLRDWFLSILLKTPLDHRVTGDKIVNVFEKDDVTLNF